MNWQFSAWWLVFGPLLFVPPVYLLRRRGPGGWLAALVCFASAAAMTAIPQGETFRLLGRPLVFGPLWVYAVALLFAATGLLFLLSLNNSQGWTFYPFGLIILTLLALSMANNHLGLNALLVEIAALVAVFIIQGGRPGSVRASLRFLVMLTLATPLFLLAARQSELYRPGLDNPVLAAQIGLLAAGGFGLWLAVAPLHGWLSAVAMEAKPGIAVFIFIAFPTTALVILLRLLGSFPWLADVPRAQEIIILAGLFSAIVGGLFAAVQKAFGPLLGYAALFDLGGSLVALGLNSRQGLTIVLFALLVRIIALLLLGTSGVLIQVQAGEDSFERVRGLARRRPIAGVGLMVGGLTLAGAPLTAGFVSRWLLLQPLSAIDPRWPAVILLGGLGVTIGYLRGLYALFQPGPSTVPPAQKWSLNLLVAGLALLCVGIGLFPKPALDAIKTIIEAMQTSIL